VEFIPGKKVVTGLTNMVIADVPTQLLCLSFPMTETNISGLSLVTATLAEVFTTKQATILL
jgi:hypothetical protein